MLRRESTIKENEEEEAKEQKKPKSKEERKTFMANLTTGTHEFSPDELVRLIKRYDSFMITVGSKSFFQIRIPTRWLKLEMGNDGVSYLTCRNKRKRDGHLFEIYGNKFIFDIDHNNGKLSGHLKTDLDGTDYYVVVWGSPDVPDDDE